MSRDWFADFMWNFRKKDPLAHHDIASIIASNWAVTKKGGGDWSDVVDDIAMVMEDVIQEDTEAVFHDISSKIDLSKMFTDLANEFWKYGGLFEREPRDPEK